MLSFAAGAAQKVKLELPVRVLSDKAAAGKLTKNDFTLLVNGEQREIAELLERERSLAGQPDLRRHFILSFHITEYGQHISDAISRLVYRFPGTGDSLILVTSIKLYRFNAIKNKEQIITDIGELVKKDAFTYKNNRTASEKVMDTAIRRINAILKRGGDRPVDTYSNTSPILAAARFLTRFNQDFSSFKTRFLLPDTGKFKKISELLSNKGGERWWLHFQQQDIYPAFTDLREAIRNIRERVAIDEAQGAGNYAKAAANKLTELEKNLMLANSFPTRQLLDLTVGRNISYNVISFSSVFGSGKKSTLATAPDLGNILKGVSKKSGGKSITSENLDQAMTEIKNHRDTYYQLLFDFDGSTADKQVEVQLPGRKEKLSFKDTFSKEEIAAIVNYNTKERVRIEGFSLKKKALKFSINNFKLHEDQGKKFGLLKVRIEFFAESGGRVYRTENTLRAGRETLGLSIPVAPKYKGRFKLHITVFDLIANNRALLIRDVKI